MQDPPGRGLRWLDARRSRVCSARLRPLLLPSASPGPGRAGPTSRAEPPSTHPALLLHPRHSAGPFNFVSCRPEKPRCQRAGSGARHVLSTSESFLLYAALATRRGQRRVRVCVHGCVHVHACVCVCACLIFMVTFTYVTLNVLTVRSSAHHAQSPCGGAVPAAHPSPGLASSCETEAVGPQLPATAFCFLPV